MAIRLGEIFVDLALETGRFDRGVASTESKLKGLGASAAATGLSIGKGLALQLGTAVAGFLSLGAVIQTASAAMEEFGNIADKSRSSGLRPEFFQGLAVAAKESGVGFDALSGALDTFNKNSGLAVEGKGKLVSQLQVLNPELLRNIQLATSQEQRILAVADAIAGETDASRQAAVAVAAFGAEGTALVATLEQGSAKLRTFMAEAKAAGLVIDEAIIRRVDEMGDKIERNTKIIDLKWKQAAVSSGPAWQALSGWAADFAVSVGYAVNRFAALDDRLYVQPLQTELKGVYAEMERLNQLVADYNAEIAAGNMAPGLKFDITEAERNIVRLRDRANELLTTIQKLQGWTPPPAETPSVPSVPLNPNFTPGLDMAWVTGGDFDPNLGGDKPEVGSGIVTGLGKVDLALETSRNNMAEWAVSMDASANAAGAATIDMAARMEGAWSTTAYMVSDSLSSLASVVGSKSRESFELSKKLSMASAVVAGIESTMQAYKSGWAVGGPLAPVLAASWAGLAAVTAAAKVAAIGATTFDSTSMAGGAAAGGAVATPGAAAGGGGVGQGVSINVTMGKGPHSTESVMNFIKDMEKALNLNGRTLNLSMINGG